jgi:hypothetical protein
MNYRKKPVVIEAIAVRDLLAASRGAAVDLPSWAMVADGLMGTPQIVAMTDHVIIATLEGFMRGDLDDIIIRGIKGELYPCKPDIFAATYEPVE